MAKDGQDNECTDEITLDGSGNGELNTDELEKAFGKKQKGKASKESDSNLGEEYNKLKSEYLYLRAEFDNFRKNTIKERSDMVKYGAERFIRQLLNVIDNFDRALEMEITAENYKDFHEGIVMTANEFKTQLDNMGVTVDDPMGQPFDPNFHEALSSEETDKVPPGHITQVFQKAYKLHDRIVRPAQVVVSKELSQAPETAEVAGEENEESES